MEERQNSTMTFVGMGLIFLLLYMWMQFSAPPKKVEDAPADPAAQQQTQQSPAPAATAAPLPAAISDTAQLLMLSAKLGAFAPAGIGTETSEVLENEFVRITFSSKGGRIKEVFFKKYEKINTDTAGNDVKSPVRLLEDAKNKFEYLIPTNNSASGTVSTADLYFAASKNGNTLTFRAPAAGGGYFEQSYTLQADNYHVDYKVSVNGLQSVLSQNQIKLQWDNYLDKLEKNQAYERTMTTVYFKETEEAPDYCNCREDAVESLGGKPVKWFSHSNQFFNTSVIANNFQFKEFTGETRMYTDADPDLKLLKTSAVIPIENTAGATADMTIYTGPNEFDRLRAYGNALEDIIPFGSSIFGTINRWVIHPMFALLSRFISSQGVVILVLTLLVKLLVYPLTYRMVLSQAKMSALKPRLDELRKKHGDDQQQMSVESMKLYSEFGVNPLGGCMPVLLQMPIWFALYRFFPAAIEFRQASFLWATDLSSYDVAMKLPWMLPGFGNHISLFTIIWVITTLWYTWYTMKQMDNAAMASDQMKIMKYMQYLMPVMFMFFFNSFASGLTCYLCFSNLLNVGQTVFTKRFLIDNEKIKQQLEVNRQKPKKGGGWRERFEQALKEQQRVQEEAQKKQNKKK